MSDVKSESSQIYVEAAKRVRLYGVSGSPVSSIEMADMQFDIGVIEHMLRAVIEAMSPEQRANVLNRVKL